LIKKINMTKQKKQNSDPVACRIPKAVDEENFDINSLESSESVTWRIFRIMSEFVSGFQFIGQYKKVVSFFGSARCEEGSKYYIEAYELSKKLSKAGFSVITGGGPGIMEAGNRGAYETGTQSLGLNIQLPFEQRINRYVAKGIGFHYFFTRKVMLSAAGQAYVFFPGGYGTLDEFFEIITLIQTQKMEKIPVVLYGGDFWGPVESFLKEVVFEKYSNIDKEDLNLFHVSDSVEDAYRIISKSKPRKDF